ncbi:MAG: choice-of-anchor U domain-containing protein [Thermodesulfobacteriota bacterium]
MKMKTIFAKPLLVLLVFLSMIIAPGTDFPSGCGQAFAIVVPVDLDFGDAPDPTYPTLLASDGARHILAPVNAAVIADPIFLGAGVDADLDGQPTAAADGDTNDDGVVFNNTLAAGGTGNVNVTVSGACFLSAWIDFNADGDWADAGEQIFSGQVLAPGVNNLNFAIPAAAVNGTTFARFRATTGGGITYTGLAPDGEVEDYQVTIVSGPEMDLLVGERALASGGTYDFGFVLVSGTAGPTVFTIENNGADVLNLTGDPKIVKGGANPGDFIVDETATVSPVIPSGAGNVANFVLPQPAGTTFTIAFTPLAGGLRSATISIANDDPDEDPYTFTVQGTGTVPNPPDTDGDGVDDTLDGCPADAAKTDPGVCGCGTADTDSDSDGTPDCNDACPNDPNKTTAGACGCGTADADGDGDAAADCNDGCPDDPDKTAAGVCGCGTADTDWDGNDVADCRDRETWPADLDLDANGIPDRDQTDIMDIATGIAGLYFGFIPPEEEIPEYLEWIDAATITDDNGRPDVSFPLGMVKFRIRVSQPGGTLELKIYCSSPIPEDAAWYKYDAVNGWYDFSSSVTVSEDRLSLTIVLRDGGAGDADGTVNGYIEDPVGPAVSGGDTDGGDGDDTTDGKGGHHGGGSCFVSVISD